MSNLSGSNPNQLQAGQMLGGMAYQSPEGVVLKPQPMVTPNGIGELVFQLANDTTLVLKVKGSDGVVRSATLTLV